MKPMANAMKVGSYFGCDAKASSWMTMIAAMTIAMATPKQMTGRRFTAKIPGSQSRTS